MQLGKATHMTHAATLHAVWRAVFAARRPRTKTLQKQVTATVSWYSFCAKTNQNQRVSFQCVSERKKRERKGHASWGKDNALSSCHVNKQYFVRLSDANLSNNQCYLPL